MLTTKPSVTFDGSGRRKGLTCFVRMHTKKVPRSREEQDIARLIVRISAKSGKK